MPSWIRWWDRFVLSLIVAAVIWLAYDAATAFAHYRPGSHNAIHAINDAWCGGGKLVKAAPRCHSGRQAARVARCEASARFWSDRPQEARNGQYRGMFQMGKWERGKFGHGPSVWHQARAAHRYWKLSWWYPWECAGPKYLGLF